ncbi:laminin subunit gamma-1 [Hydra vulgaris]|uniref:laminin subunit gamma-1 n=1 Tax=Hydra vulgaris TaxID=6087 RepID=UPI001F5F9996|nr:laminin subunit gamma-1 [Hydra vulgaris]
MGFLDMLLKLDEDVRRGLSHSQHIMLLGILLYLARYCATACYDEKGQAITCITSPINAAFKRKLDATNTCGTPPEGFCYIGPERACEICDASDPANSHPVENINDADVNSKITWWQSQTWWQSNQNGISKMFEPLKVNITLTIGKSYLISGGVYVTFYTERPKQMVIERSRDFGKTWDVYQFYAKNCRSAYNLQPDPEINPRDPFKPICSQQYSGEFPRSGGVVHFDPRTRYTPKDYYNKSVSSYLEATNIRLRLEYPGTDGREFINEETTLSQYYYAISEIRVDARCNCNGHSEFCDFQDGVEKCDCNHNTMGDDCSMCLPMFSNRLWMPGNLTHANPCEKCNCNEHTTTCVYSDLLRTGVCQNCQHNTRGVKCDRCIDGYYRNISRDLSDENVCIPCDCYPPGITDDGKCLQNPTGTQQLGQCNCKNGIYGRRCDQCVPGKWGYSKLSDGACIDCSCNSFGTQNSNQLCDPYTGNCFCKSFITGRACDTCKDGYYIFPTSIKKDCVPCPCNVGGSFPSCDKSSGTCSCKPGVIGLKCDMVDSGYFFPNFTYLKFEPEFLSPNGTFSTYYLARNYAKYHTGFGFIKLDYGQWISFQFQVPTNAYYFIMLRYSLFNLDWYSSILPSGRENVDWDGKNDMQFYLTSGDQPEKWELVGKIIGENNIEVQNAVFSIADLNMGNDNSVASKSSFLLKQNVIYTFSLYYDEDSGLFGNPWPFLIDSLSVMIDYNLTSYFKSYSLINIQNEIKNCFEASKNLETTYNLPGFCKLHTFTIDLEVYGRALECNCYAPGSYNWNQCAEYGGQCQCKEGFGDRSCDQCVPGYFGSPGVGCSPCHCSDVGSLSDTCHQITGQCSCKQNAHGLKCDECKLGFYHLNEMNPKGCQECFGYGHLVSCQSAMGFISTYIETSFAESSDTYDNWTLLNEDGSDISSYILQEKDGIEYTNDKNYLRYFNAPMLFLGNQLYSFGQLLLVEMEIFPMFEVLVSKVPWHVRLIGNGQVALFRFKETISKFRTLYSVILHQDYMINATKLREFDFKAMLGQLSGLHIGTSFFEAPVTITLKNVRLYTAVFNPSNYNISIMVDYVELAKCLTGYKGRSCEECDVGYTRVIPYGSPLINCVPCSCNGRTKECDPQTGECKNCMPGTIGKYCESCMENVLEPKCDKCRPGYWGLCSQLNGCRPCDCYLPGTQGGNNNECDSLTGQCVCDSQKNVGGRQCNLCKENSFNISLTVELRCQECPVCYGLIENSVLQLRSNILQVQIQILNMVSKLSSMTVSPFYQSISSMRSDIINLARRADQGLSVASGLDLLWKSLDNSVNLFLNTLSNSTYAKMESLLMGANNIFAIHNSTVFQYSAIFNYLITSFNLINNTVRARMQQQGVALEQLRNLGNEMVGYVAIATRRTNEVLTKKYDLKQKIQVSINAAVQAASTAKLTRETAFNMTFTFEPVLLRGREVQSIARTCLAAIQDWFRNASRVLLYSQTVLNATTSPLVDNSKNITSLGFLTQALRDRFNGFTTSVFSLTTNVNSVALEITKLKTSLHQTQISAIERRSSLLYTNIVLLYNKTILAVNIAKKTYDDAWSMLNTVKNFMVVASQAKRAANEALTQVDNVKITVESALQTAVSISNQLRGPIATIATALQVSNAASLSTGQETQVITSLYQKAVVINERTKSAVSFVKSEQIFVYIQQNVAPLLDRCNSYKSKSISARKEAQNALTQSQQAFSVAKTTADRIKLLASNIDNLQTVQVSQLDSLIENIYQGRANYNKLSLSSALENLKKAIADQDLKTKAYKIKKSTLQVSIDRFESLYQSLKQVSC